MTKPNSALFTQWFSGSLLLFFLLVGVSSAMAVTTVVGQIESVYQNRASMRLLDVPVASSTPAILKVGNRVSFLAPAYADKRNKSELKFGNVLEVDLEGNVATEYGENAASNSVFIWTATRCLKVKNPKKYIGESSDKKGKKGKRGKKDEPKEAPQIWTQEESVRGQVFMRPNDKHLYIKEEGLRPKDKGLEVTSDEWFEKLKAYNGRKVVIQGTTHRTSLSSGTIDISSILKLSPKN